MGRHDKLNRRSLILIGLIYSLILSLVILRNMIFSHGIILYGDMTWAVVPEVNSLPFYAWQFQMSAPQVGSSMTPIYLFMALNVELCEKILLIFTLFITSFSGFYMIYYFTRNSTNKFRLIACLTAATLMVLNPFVYDRFLGHLSMVWGFGLSPLILIMFIRSLDNDQNWKRFAVIGAVLLAFASIDLHSGIWNILLLASYLIYHIVISGKSIPDIFKLLRKPVLFLIIFVALTAYWSFPQLLSPQQGHPYFAFTVDSLTYLSDRALFLNTIRLSGSQLSSALNPTFLESNSPLLLLTFIPTMFSLTAILLKPKSKMVVFFTILLPILLFLSQGNKGPGGSFYQWLTFESPISSFGWILRDSSRAAGLLSAVYAFLSAITIYEICTRISTTRISVYIRQKKNGKFQNRWLGRATKYFAIIAVVSLLFGSVIITMRPMVNSNFSDLDETTHLMKSVQLPKEYINLNNLLRTQADHFKVLWMPYDRGQFSYTWNDDTVISNLGVFAGSRPSMYLTYSGIDASRFLAYTYYDSLLQNRTNNFGKMISIMDMKYVIFHDDYLDYKSSYDNSSFVHSRLVNQSDLTQIWIDGSMQLFENDNKNNPLFIPQDTMSIVGGLDGYVYLNNLGSFKPTEWAIAYAEQTPQMNPDQLKNSNLVFFFNKDFSDFLFSTISKDHIIQVVVPDNPLNLTQNPKDDTNLNWGSYAISASDFLQESTFNEIKDVSNKIPSSFDYDQGFIITNKTNAQMDSTFSIKSTDTYGLWARVMMNNNAGNIIFKVDGQILTSLDAFNEQDKGYTWVNIGNRSLDQGSHKLSIINQNGSNVINVLASIPINDFSNLESSAKSLLEQSSSRFSYVYGKTNLDSVSTTELSKIIYAPRNDNYSLTIQTNSNNDYTLKIDGIVQELSNPTKSDSYWTYSTASIYLPEGDHSIQLMSLNASAINALDYLSLFSSVNQKTVSPAEFFEASPPKASVLDYTYIDPISVTATVNASEPFILVLPESFNSLWSLNVEGKEISPMPVYSFLNGFEVNQTGILKLSITYKPQNLQPLFIYASGISLFITLSYLSLSVFRMIYNKRKYVRKDV